MKQKIEHLFKILNHLPNLMHAHTFKEGPEGVKWELGFAHFLAGKMGFHALGLGFINKKQ